MTNKAGDHRNIVYNNNNPRERCKDLHLKQHNRALKGNLRVLVCTKIQICSANITQIGHNAPTRLRIGKGHAEPHLT